MSSVTRACFNLLPLLTLSCMGGIEFSGDGSNDAGHVDHSAEAQPDPAPDDPASDLSDLGSDDLESDLGPDDLESDLGPDIPGPDLDVTPEPDRADAPGPDLPPDTSDATEGDDGTCSVGLVGDPCVSPDQCGCIPAESKECLITIAGYLNFSGGYCTARCTSLAECGSEALCAEVYTGVNYCLKICTSPAQCRMAEGYTCGRIPMSSDTRTYCLPDMEPED